MRRFSFTCLVVVALTAVSSTTASPISTLSHYFRSPTLGEGHTLRKRQRVNCYNIRSAFDSSCWGVLDLSDWLNNPTTGWNHTHPPCDMTQDSSQCCVAGEPWTTCFLRLGHGTGGSDCSQINVQTCSLDLHQSVNDTVAVQYHYVMKTIYSIKTLTCQTFEIEWSYWL